MEEDFNIEFGETDQFDIGDEVQEVAAPAEQGVEDVESAEPQPMKGNQSASEAAVAAAARRQAEAENKAEIERLRKEQSEAAAIVDKFKKLAIASGFTDVEEMYSASIKNVMDSGITPDNIGLLVESNPAFQQIQAFEQRLSQVESLKQELEQAKVSQKINDMMADFKTEFPNESINSPADFETVLGSDKYPQFYDNVVRRGMDYAEAYTLANRKAIAQKAVAAGKQAAINQIGSKAHLQKTTGGGGDVSIATVPPDEARMYRMMFPDITDKEIVEHYTESKKG